MGRMAVKQLTGSDLTLFEWQFRNRSASNQKSINLNANVFIDELYPSLPNTDAGRIGRLGIDLFLYGPGNAGAWNLQRKIIKGETYKNWRLNGEFISNPDDSPERFNALAPGDFAIFDFEGDLVPIEARIVFVAAALPEDAMLHAGISDYGIGSMRAIQMPQLRLIVHASGTPESHPIYELLLDAAIEDAARGGIEGTRKLLSRSNGRRLTKAELERARQRADDIGRMGEEMMNGYFLEERAANRIHNHEWVSNDNAISPFDFWLNPTPRAKVKVEVKSTAGDHNQVLHISLSELIAMSLSPEPYHIYRVYKLDDRQACLRIADDVKRFAEGIIATLANLPTGVAADGVSVRPDALSFGPEIQVHLRDDDPVDDEYAGGQ